MSFSPPFAIRCQSQAHSFLSEGPAPGTALFRSTSPRSPPCPSPSLASLPVSNYCCEQMPSEHPVVVLSLSHVQLFCNPMDYNSPGSLSVAFPRQEYWSVLPCPPPGDLPDPGIKSTSLMSPALAGSFFTTRAIWEVPGSILGLA